MVADPVNVWILGSSIIKHATVAASQRIGGTNLSIPNANIWWQGYSGMNLLDLVPKLKYLKGLKLQSPPHIIVVHCGANNVGKTRLDRLLTMVHDILSQCKIIPKNQICVVLYPPQDNMALFNKHKSHEPNPNPS